VYGKISRFAIVKIHRQSSYGNEGSHGGYGSGARNVMEARVVYDRDIGISKGFGFMTYGYVDEANKAIESLYGLNVDGINTRVTIVEARYRPRY
ncbi:29 kDa ribonucleoprotein A, chloroplastic, partial [Tanacetum coccineum]